MFNNIKKRMDEDITSAWDGPVCDKVGYEGFMEETDGEDDDKLPSNVVERASMWGNRWMLLTSATAISTQTKR